MLGQQAYRHDRWLMQATPAEARPLTSLNSFSRTLSFMVFLSLLLSELTFFDFVFSISAFCDSHSDTARAQCRRYFASSQVQCQGSNPSSHFAYLHLSRGTHTAFARQCPPQ